MIWFAIILAVFVGGVTGFLKQSLFQGLRAGVVTLLLGIAVSVLVVLSGILGG